MPFVIIALPRTGSTHLTTLLHSHHDIICHGEIFHPKGAFVRLRSADRTPQAAAELAALRVRDPRAFLKYIFDRNYGRIHVGFKIFKDHNNEILDELIADPNVRKIVLYRRNMLAVYSSSRIAQSIGQRILAKARDAQPLVQFEAEEFRNYCKRYARFYRDVAKKISRTRQIFHLVHYEGVNDQTLFANLVNFIGADPFSSNLRAISIKQNSSSLLERFSNPAAVEKFLRSHELLDWLYESEVSLDPFGDRTRTDVTIELAADGEEELRIFKIGP
jgi:hypothetical protein